MASSSSRWRGGWILTLGSGKAKEPVCTCVSRVLLICRWSNFRISIFNISIFDGLCMLNAGGVIRTLMPYQSLRVKGSTVFFLRPFLPLDNLLFL